MNNLKDRVKTVLVVVGILIITGVGFLIHESLQRKDALIFAFNHSDVVAVVSDRYASEEARVKDGFVKKEKTAQDKLIEAVADEVKKQ